MARILKPESPSGPSRYFFSTSEFARLVFCEAIPTQFLAEFCQALDLGPHPSPDEILKSKLTLTLLARNEKDRRLIESWATMAVITLIRESEVR